MWDRPHVLVGTAIDLLFCGVLLVLTDSLFAVRSGVFGIVPQLGYWRLFGCGCCEVLVYSVLKSNVLLMMWSQMLLGRMGMDRCEMTRCTIKFRRTMATPLGVSLSKRGLFSVLFSSTSTSQQRSQMPVRLYSVKPSGE